MKRKTLRLYLLAVSFGLLSLAVGLALYAFQNKIVFFFSPSDIAANRPSEGQRVRLGGLVEAGSLAREPNSLTVHFRVTDTAQTIPVAYTGLLPDLFKEGKGVVAQGTLGPDGVFRASEVLAKHDENYMPPAAADAVKKAHDAMSTKTLVTRQGAGK